MGAAESALVEAWYGRAWWLWLLRPLELLFRTASAVRKWLYRFGISRVYRAPVPVIVVGNITVGGTGKTPIVIALVEHLQRSGLHPGVVSRGYGASAETFPYRVNKTSTATDCGDEPLLISQRTGAAVVVAPARDEAIRELVKEDNLDLVISDDGLQHYAMARDIEIVVFDEQRGAGNGFCLPAGPLREPISRLSSVDYVLYRGSKDPVDGVVYVYEALVNLVTSEERAVSTEGLGGEVHAVAAIGQPDQFYHFLQECGFAIQRHQFADHHAFKLDDFSKMNDKPIIMTEKDAVKCRAMNLTNAWYLKMSAQLPERVLESVASLAKSDRRQE